MEGQPLDIASQSLRRWEREIFSPIHRAWFASARRLPLDWQTLRHVLFYEILAPAAILIAYHRDGAAVPTDWLHSDLERRLWQRLTGRVDDSTRPRRHSRQQSRRRWQKVLRSLTGLRREFRPAPPAEGMLLTQSTQRSADTGGDPAWGDLQRHPAMRSWLHLDWATRGDDWAPAGRHIRIWETQLLKAYLRHRSELAGALRRIAADEAWQAAISRLSVLDMSLAELASDIWPILLSAARHSMLVNLAAQRLMDRQSIRTLSLYMEYSAPAYQLMAAARHAGVRVVAVQHGDLVEDVSPGLLHCELEETCRPDVTCVYGEHYRQLMIRHGRMEPSQVVVTGSPRNGLTALPVRNPRGPALILSQNCLSSASRWEMHRRLAEALKDCDSSSYLIKLHPFEPQDVLEAGIYPAATQFITGKATVPEALDGCSAVVGATSVALLESLHMGFPVVAMDLSYERMPLRPELAPLLMRCGPDDSLSAMIEQARRMDCSLDQARQLVRPFIASQGATHALLNVLIHG